MHDCGCCCHDCSFICKACAYSNCHAWIAHTCTVDARAVPKHWFPLLQYSSISLRPKNLEQSPAYFSYISLCIMHKHIHCCCHHGALCLTCPFVSHLKYSLLWQDQPMINLLLNFDFHFSIKKCHAFMFRNIIQHKHHVLFSAVSCLFSVHNLYVTFIEPMINAKHACVFVCVESCEQMNFL